MNDNQCQKRSLRSYKSEEPDKPRLLKNGIERPKTLQAAVELLEELAPNNSQIKKVSAPAVAGVTSPKASASADEILQKYKIEKLEKELKSKDVSINALLSVNAKQKAELASRPLEPWEESITDLQMKVGSEQDPAKRQAYFRRLKAAQAVPRCIVSGRDGKKEYVQKIINGVRTLVEIPNSNTKYQL